MFTAAGAMEDVDIWQRLVRVRFERFDLMVLGMAATAPDLLVVLHRLQVTNWEKVTRKISNLDSRTGDDVRRGQFSTLRNVAIPFSKWP